MPTSNDAFADDLASLLPNVAAAPDRYRAQAMCRVAEQSGSDWTYRVDLSHPDREFIYPASRIKLVLAIAALERINQLARDTGLPIDENSPLIYRPLFVGEEIETLDTGEGESSAGLQLTLARLIWRSLVASENEPSNKLYEFVGWSGMRAWAARHGLPDIRIEHRLAEFRTVDEQRWTPRIQILADKEGVDIPELRPQDALSGERIADDPHLMIGSAFRDQHGTFISRGMDFSTKNRFGLCAAINVLKQLADRRFALKDSQYQLLSIATSTPPHLSINPKYIGPMWSAERFKPMLRGLTETRPANEWLISNKIGEAYGFASDMATIQHVPTGRTIHAAASIWCCASGVLNADIYEYDTVGRPFLQLVGTHIGRLML